MLDFSSLTTGRFPPLFVFNISSILLRLAPFLFLSFHMICLLWIKLFQPFSSTFSFPLFFPTFVFLLHFFFYSSSILSSISDPVIILLYFKYLLHLFFSKFFLIFVVSIQIMISRSHLLYIFLNFHLLLSLFSLFSWVLFFFFLFFLPLLILFFIL